MRNHALNGTKLLALALLLASPFSGCLNDGGTEIPNEVRGTLYTSSGTPAANAQVRLYPVGFAPSDSANAVSTGFATQTNASGRFTLKKVPAGEYNLVASGQNSLAFQDSILLTEGTRELAADTLRAPGTITATVQLQPQHSPQTAFVQVLGTQYYTNVAANGRFTLTLPQGSYRLRVSTILPEYVPLFVSVSATSGVNDTLAEPLEPFYSGIPVVTGLTATPDSSGVITLTWKAPKSGGVQAYLIYRDSVGTIVPSTTPYKSTTDTVFRDTIYTTKSPTPSGRFYQLDTSVHAFNYRVRILDGSDNVGPVFGNVRGTPIPLARKYSSGRWHRAAANVPFGQRLRPSVIAFNNALWLFGGNGNGTTVPNGNTHNTWTDVWSSSDGMTWTKVGDSLPFSQNCSRIQATAHADKLWLICRLGTGVAERRVVMDSDNGLSWFVVKDSLPIPNPDAFFSFKDTMYTFFGSGNANANPQFHHSKEGIVWAGVIQASPLWPSANATNQLGGVGGVEGGLRGGAHIALHEGKAWVAGGGNGGTGWGVTVWSSSDVRTWSPVFTETRDFLPRVGHNLLSHDGKLWSVGGRHPLAHELGLTHTIQSQIWNSVDGTSWNLVDIAPFPSRDLPAAVSFNGRLWVIGGIQADGTNDIWYYE